MKTTPVVEKKKGEIQQTKCEEQGEDTGTTRIVGRLTVKKTNDQN